jgi:prolyl oligopeptidase
MAHRLAPLSLLVLLAACVAPAPGPTAPVASAPATESSSASAPAAPVAAVAAAPALAYPATRRVDASDVFFGVTVPDPYRWLEDGSAPEVQAWIAAQDKLARDTLATLPGRDAIRDRLGALSYLEWAAPPRKRGGRSFYVRKSEKGEKTVVYWREGDKGEERVLLDPAQLSPDGTVSLGIWAPSYDGKTVAYVVHPNNADAGTVHVKDVATGKESAIDVIGGAKYASPKWTPKGDGFYYVALPTDPKIPGDELPGHSDVRFHKLGTDPKTDAVLLPKNGNPETELDVGLSRDGHWLITTVIRGASAIEIHYLDLRRPTSPRGAVRPPDPPRGAVRPPDPPWVTLVKGHDGSMDAVAWKDQIYLRTTDGAPQGRLFRVDPAKPARDQWKEIVPESKDAVLESASVIGGHLALGYLRSAASEIEIRTLEGKKVRTLALPGLGSTQGLIGEPDDDTAYYFFTSFTNPGAIYQTSLRTGEGKLWYALKAPVDPSGYEVEQVKYPSKDGTKVSMFVVRRKGAPRDGSTPFLLTGYGGFNVSLTPYFDRRLFVWLEAGGGVAVPNLRGGGEYGEAWHQAGALTRKQNTFDDFIAAAEHLVQSGYTRPDRLVIEGRSNGGLLVGAALTQRPDLFRVALCGVPVLDMVRFPRFGDGKTWIADYGSPAKEAEFKALFAYSPYHRVKPGTSYPAVLMLSVDADDRVAPLHGWKMTAALQAASKSGRPVLMRVEKNAGHRGADEVKSGVERLADALAFALHEMGIAPAFKAACAPTTPGPAGK